MNGALESLYWQISELLFSISLGLISGTGSLPDRVRYLCSCSNSTRMYAVDMLYCHSALSLPMHLNISSTGLGAS